jgi:hypothetical protein
LEKQIVGSDKKLLSKGLMGIAQFGPGMRNEFLNGRGKIDRKF